MDSYRKARAIMQNFAIDTHLTPGLNGTTTQARRYLWTDAFAVCNYLSLYRQNAEPIYLQQALSLVTQVHQTLGQYRQDSTDTSWLSGLEDKQAQLHPTIAGLRIGKTLHERHQSAPVDESLEWQQDGQYFHYLTKWMHALDCVSRDTGNSIYTQWAVELAKVAHSAFVYTPPKGGSKSMYWKMSIDLSRPLVSSMGHHDPLDGLLTYLQLQDSLTHQPDLSAELNLDTEIADMLAICSDRSWASHDALGIGGLLGDAYKLLQLSDKPYLHESIKLGDLLDDIEQSLHALFSHDPLQQKAEYRLAFRELGLAIGLQAIGKMQQHISQNPGHLGHLVAFDGLLTRLAAFEPVHVIIENFWLSPENQAYSSWLEHADINNVILASSLVPEGYLQLTRHCNS